MYTSPTCCTKLSPHMIKVILMRYCTYIVRICTVLYIYISNVQFVVHVTH